MRNNRVDAHLTAGKQVKLKHLHLPLRKYWAFFLQLQLILVWNSGFCFSRIDFLGKNRARKKKRSHQLQNGVNFPPLENSEKLPLLQSGRWWVENCIRWRHSFAHRHSAARIFPVSTLLGGKISSLRWTTFEEGEGNPLACCFSAGSFDDSMMTMHTGVFAEDLE